MSHKCNVSETSFFLWKYHHIILQRVLLLELSSLVLRNKSHPYFLVGGCTRPFHHMHTIINANILSRITHQLNIKQYHEMTTEYLSFIHFMDRLLDPSALSSSSFMTSSFLIQMLRWIRGSSRIEFFIFLIAWGIFFESSELDI